MTFYTKSCVLSSQAKEFIQIADILDAVTASDSECEVLSGEDESDDKLWELDDVERAGDDSYHADDDVGGPEDTVGDDNDDSDYDVPLANRMKKKPKKYKFEKRRPFVPPQLPPFIPEPERPTPDDGIPIEYVNMFLTDDMIENLLLQSNKYATEKTGLCPNFTKAELQTYFGIYYLMGIVRLPKIDDYWRSDLWYGQIADKMSRL